MSECSCGRHDNINFPEKTFKATPCKHLPLMVRQEKMRSHMQPDGKPETVLALASKAAHQRSIRSLKVRIAQIRGKIYFL